MEEIKGLMTALIKKRQSIQEDLSKVDHTIESLWSICEHTYKDCYEANHPYYICTICGNMVEVNYD